MSTFHSPQELRRRGAKIKTIKQSANIKPLIKYLRKNSLRSPWIPKNKQAFSTLHLTFSQLGRESKKNINVKMVPKRAISFESKEFGKRNSGEATNQPSKYKMGNKEILGTQRWR